MSQEMFPGAESANGSVSDTGQSLAHSRCSGLTSSGVSHSGGTEDNYCSNERLLDDMTVNIPSFYVTAPSTASMELCAR